MDEQWLIIANSEYLKSWYGLSDAFTKSLYSLYYRPLLLVSIAVDYKIGALSPFIYHITNLCWHLAAVFSLFRLLTIYKVSPQNSVILCLLFSLHPMMLQAVAWVPGRNDLMLCFFTLNSIIFLKKYTIENKTRFLAWFILFYLGALLTKENAISLPLLYLAVVYKEISFKKGVVLLGVLMVFSIIWLIIRSAIVGEIAHSSISYGSRFLAFCKSFLFYLGKNLFPVNQSVYPTLKLSGIIAGIVGVLIICLLWHKKLLNDLKTAITGILFFSVLLILPLWFSSGKYNSELFEHRSYTSACGLILFLSQIKINYYSNKVLPSLISILLLFFLNSFTRMDVYKDKISFLSQGIKEEPGYYLFQAQYAGFLESKGNFSLALECYNSAIKLRPDKHILFNDRGRVHCILGDYNSAVKDINSAMKISGFNAEYCLNRCIVFDAMGDVENAMKDLVILNSCCAQIVPTDLKKGINTKWRKNLDELNKQITLEANNGNLLYKRAEMHLVIEDKEKAFKDVEEALKKEPQNEKFKKLYFEILL